MSAEGVGDGYVNKDVVTVNAKLKCNNKVRVEGYLHNNNCFRCFILPFALRFEHSCCSRRYAPFEV